MSTLHFPLPIFFSYFFLLCRITLLDLLVYAKSIAIWVYFITMFLFRYVNQQFETYDNIFILDKNILEYSTEYDPGYLG